jgi:hypothetical protein
MTNTTKMTFKERYMLNIVKNRLPIASDEFLKQVSKMIKYEIKQRKGVSKPS